MEKILSSSYYLTSFSWELRRENTLLPQFSLGSLKNGDFVLLRINKRLNSRIESFRIAVGQGDSSDKCSIMVTFTEVTD